MKPEILNHLPGTHPWQNLIHWYEAIDSTNTLAKRMIAQGAPHGTVIIADRQTQGRGRMGRSFQSPAGFGVYLSVILRYNCRPEALMHLTCAAAVAMCDAVEQAASLRPSIKWTNDLVHNGRKLGGILTELVISETETAAIVGIGINCNQTSADFSPEIRDFAGSLFMATGNNILRPRLIASMLRSLYDMDLHLFSCKDILLECYREDCITLGKEVSIVRGEEIRHGHALAVADDGGLVVKFSDGNTETVSSGEVSVRGMYGYV